MAKQVKKKGSSLDDPINATSGIKGTPRIAAKDTVHVRSTAGYDMAVKRGSAYAKQAKDLGAVVDAFRPGGGYTENTDTFSVKNYKKRPKKK
jgi:hypothetical protein